MPIELTRREREILASIEMAPIPYAEGRNWSNEYRALLQQKLVRHDGRYIRITPLGAEVAQVVS